jgi:hypothetical protein
MNKGMKLVIGMTIGTMMAPIMMAALVVPAYVPSLRLAKLAREASNPSLGRQEIANRLNSGRSRHRESAYRDIDPRELGETVRRFRSWANDEGLIAVTDIRCPVEQRCLVSSSALIRYRWLFGE